jgi:release factor glutamine methyltransferase
VKFRQADLFDLSSLDLLGSFDSIVSNPPYVRQSEKSEMKAHVLEHEPELALFVPDHDPLIFYRKILDLCRASRTPEMHIYFEINEAMGKEMKTLMEHKGVGGVKILSDLHGKDRIAFGTLRKQALNTQK